MDDFMLTTKALLIKFHKFDFKGTVLDPENAAFWLAKLDVFTLLRCENMKAVIVYVFNSEHASLANRSLFGFNQALYRCLLDVAIEKARDDLELEQEANLM